MKQIFSRLGLLAVVMSMFAAVAVQAQDGEALYEQYCAACHDDPVDRAPSRAALGDYNANAVFHAMTAGIMQTQAANLSQEQRIALAEHLTNTNYNRDRVESYAACAAPLSGLDLQAAGNWNGWGTDLSGQRYQDASGSNISAATIDSLEVAWTMGVEAASSARGNVTVIDGVMFYGAPSGMVRALDVATGCQYWDYAAIGEVRAAMSVVELDGAPLLVLADLTNRVYVLDALTGSKRWHADVDDNPWAVSTGAPAVHGGKVFVPVSSMEVAGAGNPQHVCCTFRGNVAALDLTSGEKLWHTYIMKEPEQVGSNSVGNPVLAPSGAPIWSSATINPEHNRVYVGTGQNYSRPTSDTSDSVIGFDMDSGAMDLVYQTTADDAFTMGCSGRAEHPNCPDPGPDVDIGAAVLTTTLSNGQDILVAGTKGARVYGIDPASGERLWVANVGRGSPLGGVHWGMTYVDDVVYVPVSDRIPGGSSDPQPGLHALDMKTGESLWYAPAPERCEQGNFSCSNAYSAPPSATNDLVITGALNGYLFAHDRATGELVWEMNTRREFDSLNGVPASGGAIDATGPVISGDYLIFNSGYATFGQLPGNALIVMKLPE